MLEKYKDTQPVLFNLLMNAIKNNKLSHAYLFETNDNPDALDIVYSFVKEIFCPGNLSCDKCNLCKRIDDGNFLEIKLIKPDGMQIKKEQMEELQEQFSKISLESDKKIYIIDECDKMNLQAANSILKFLEEPTNNIIAILVTNNINKVIKTIVSRCQVISLNKEILSKSNNSYENLSFVLTNCKADRENFLLDDKKKKLYEDVINFISFYEKNRNDTIIYIKKLFHDNLKERQDYIMAFDIMINFYYDVLKYKVSGQANIFISDIDLIKEISINSIDSISYVLDLFVNIRRLLNNNLNINLLTDYMVIKLKRRC